VAAGILDPRRIAVPLAGLEPGIRLILGMVDEVDVTSGRAVLADPVKRRLAGLPPELATIGICGAGPEISA
jgi:hypothetical protein